MLDIIFVFKSFVFNNENNYRSLLISKINVNEIGVLEFVPFKIFLANYSSFNSLLQRK